MENRVIGKPAALILAGLAVGVVVEQLCFGQAIGLGTTLAALATAGALLAVGAAEGRSPVWRNVAALGVPLLFFALALSVRAHPFLTALNLIACLLLLPLLMRFAFTDDVRRLTLGAILGSPWFPLGYALHPSLREGIRATSGTMKGDRLMPLLRGLLLAAPVLLVLVPLLASADAVFARLVDRLLGGFRDARWDDLSQHLLIALAAGVLAAGGFAWSLLRIVRDGAEPDTPRGGLGFTEAMTVLGAVILVFATFVAVQIAYLFGGHARVAAMPGLTYAEYAHRGFGEITAAATIALLLVQGLRSVTDRASDGKTHGFRWLGSALLGLTIVMLASAAHRMTVYEEAYGASVLRLYVDTFLFWLGAALLWLLATLWRARWERRFWIGGFACALLWTAMLDLVNPDAVVVRQSVARQSRTGTLDRAYLATLSEDAAPDLATLDRGLLPERTISSADWRSWNWARWRARSLR